MLLRAAKAGTLLLTAVGCALISGCQPEKPDAIHVDSSESPPAATNTKAIPIAEVKLETVDGDGYQAALAKHKGNVVLVDFWATWCEPCTENFPHIVELHEQHVGDGLRVIGFSNDALSDTEAVKQFLAEHGAAFDNLQTKFGVSTETNDTFGIHGVPYYKLYDRKGELRYQFAEVYDDLEHGEPVKKIDERVAELLAESPS